MITPGTRIAHYDVLATIGAGGMGEVYRAKDTLLGREVALKVLPEFFAADADRRARFQREAKTLAALNHPNIAAIHGLAEAPNVSALVLVVDGETLAQRIDRGPIPLDETLAIATQIAAALESAHERGIVHRDLKPANVQLTSTGAVKVLDFGLAKLVEASGSSPTNQSAALVTEIGVPIGTAAYMSPEQVRGQTVEQAHRYLGIRLRGVRNAHCDARVRRWHGFRHAFERAHATTRSGTRTAERSAAAAQLPRAGRAPAPARHRRLLAATRGTGTRAAAAQPLTMGDSGDRNRGCRARVVELVANTIADGGAARAHRT